MDLETIAGVATKESAINTAENEEDAADNREYAIIDEEDAAEENKSTSTGKTEETIYEELHHYLVKGQYPPGSI